MFTTPHVLSSIYPEGNIAMYMGKYSTNLESERERRSTLPLSTDESLKKTKEKCSVRSRAIIMPRQYSLRTGICLPC